jgi:hypothetical protein
MLTYFDAGNFEVGILTNDNFEVDILTYDNFKANILTNDNLKVDILTAGNVEVSKKHQHIGIKHISCLDKQNV